MSLLERLLSKKTKEKNDHKDENILQMILYSTLHYFNETTQINNKILESGEDSHCTVI